MSGEIVLLKSESVIPAGTNVLAVWVGGAVLPQESALREAIGVFGETWTLSYLGRAHVGVTLAQDREAWRIQAALAAVCNGAAPLLVSAPPDLESVIDLETLGDTFKEGVKDMAEGVVSVVSTTGSIATSLPWIIGAAVLGAALVVVGGIVYLKKKG